MLQRKIDVRHEHESFGVTAVFVPVQELAELRSDFGPRVIMSSSKLVDWSVIWQARIC